MAFFNYQAADLSGKLIEGSMEAVDENALVERLQEMGYFPIGVGEPDKNNAGRNTVGSRPFFMGLVAKIRFSRVSGRKILDFTHQLHSMLEAGLPLDRTLAVLSDLEENFTFKEILQELRKRINNGKTLAGSLEKFPRQFPHTYVSMIKAGEIGGVLETVLARLNNYLEESQKLKDEILSALIYPMILTVVGGSAVLFMLFFVIPRFSLILADMGGSLPMSTQILLTGTEILLKYWWFLLAGVISAIIIIKHRLKTEKGKIAFDRIKLKLPGGLVRKILVSRFSRTFGTLLQSDIPIIDAIQIAMETMGNKAFAAKINPVIEGVRKGKGLTLPIKESGCFPPLAVHMLALGEETGKLDEMLIRLSDKYDLEIKNTIKRLLSFMEPAIIFVMALMVGFIVVSLLLAIFSLNDMPL